MPRPTGTTRTGFRLPAAPEQWTRRRLQILLIITIAVLCCLAGGVVWAAATMLHSPRTAKPATRVSNHARQTTVRQRLAAAPLPAATLEQAQPGRLSTRGAGALRLPTATTRGAVNVVTGFPHTAGGAMAQLVAIDQRAIESTSIATAQDVIAHWAVAGGPTPQTWSGVRAVATLLSSAGVPADQSENPPANQAGFAVSLSPTMGFIKARDGADFVIPCVDFVATAVLGASTSRIAVADCQQLVWRDGRWLIGPGAEPAPPPSLWPGTPAALAAGYRWLQTVTP